MAVAAIAVWAGLTSWSGLVQAQGFDPGLYAAPADGGARRWQVTARAEAFRAAGGDTDVLAVLESGAVVSNLGCAFADGRRWCQVRPLSGGPKVHVAAEFLRPVAGPDGMIAAGPDDSDRRARGAEFDAEAQVQCAQEVGERLAGCPAGVARASGGDATVVVTFASGFKRRLFFEHGRFIRANATMSGAGRDIDWLVEDAVFVIRVDDQRFEIPVAFVTGQ